MAKRRRIQAAADTEAEILIYNEIGPWGIRAADILAQLKAVDAATVHVRINSPGGDVTDATAIFNALRNHGARIVTHVDALAASSASLIAMAGDEIKIAGNAFLMIHNPWAGTWGDADEHRRMADVLDKFAAMINATYREQSGAAKDQVKQWMDDETWFTAEEALEAKLVTAIDEATDVEAAFDLSSFHKTPAVLRDATRGRIAAGPRMTRPFAQLAPTDPDEDPTMTEKEIQALKDQLADLTGKLDVANATIAQHARLTLIEQKLAAAQLPDALVTPVLRNQMVRAKDEVEIDALLAERKTIAAQVGGTRATSTERVVTEPTAPAATPVTDAVVSAAAALFRKS